jgi:hypothetical protein
MEWTPDAFLKVSIAASCLVAASGLGYYYGIHLPQRELRLDDDRRAAEARQEAARVAQQERLEQEKEKAVADAEAERLILAAEKEAGRRAAEARRVSSIRRYESCLDVASSNYNGDWDSACKLRADQARIRLKECRDGGTTQVVCAQRVGDVPPAADCTLPKVAADTLETRLNAAKELCLKERQAGL